MSDDERKMFGCMLCNGAFSQKVHLKTHMENVHKQPLQDFKMVLASQAGAKSSTPKAGPGVLSTFQMKKFISEGHVRINKVETGDEEKAEIEDFSHCRACGMTISEGTKTAYNSHINITHQGKRYPCNICRDKLFKFKSSLLDHKMKRHGIDLPRGCEVYECQVGSCSYMSPSRIHMLMHLRSKHFKEEGAGEKKQSQCYICGKKYQNQVYVNEHINRVHRKEKHLKCEHPGCKFKAYNRHGITNHMRIHTSSLEDRKAVNAATCEECGHTSLNNAHLMEHIKIVHRKIKEFCCKVCESKFVNKTNLLEHIGIKHMGYSNAKEWRKPENAEARKSAVFHEAYEYRPDKEWEAMYKKIKKRSS